MSVEETIRQIVTRIVHCEDKDITPTSTWKDLEADSLDLVQILVAVEEAFDIEIQDEDAEKLTNMGDMVAYIERSQAEHAA